MRHKAQDPNLRVIRASELGEYSYCSRAWWYRHVLKISPPGHETSERLEAGVEAHTSHSRAVALSGALRAIGIALALFGLLALALALMTR
jgi:CRISPR/Cas system-associated exonuclease Cas4 (RecB family)